MKTITIILLTALLSFNVQSQDKFVVTEGDMTMGVLTFTTSTFLGVALSYDKNLQRYSIRRGVIAQVGVGVGMSLLKEFVLDNITGVRPANIQDFGFNAMFISVGSLVTAGFLKLCQPPKEQRFKL